MGRKWAWNQLFSWGTRLSSRNCMSAIWINGKNPVSLFIHLILGLSKSQKNCQEEICSCSKASCSLHLLAKGIVSLFASSWNAALSSAATNSEGEWAKKRWFLLFTCQTKKHRFCITTSLRNCRRPGFWQLYSMRAPPAASRHCMEMMPSSRKTFGEIMTALI